MKFEKPVTVAVAFAACMCPAFAQGSAEQSASVVAPQQPDGPGLAAPVIAQSVIPRLTPVSLEILADLSSNGSKSLESFPVRLARPIELNGDTLVREGAMGMGEVVHAKKAGGSGAPGELILAARYLEVDGRKMPLRSLRFAEAGESKIKTVNTLNVATAATVPVVAFVGFFMKGGEIAVAKGSLVEAKLSQDFEVAAAPTDYAAPADGAQHLEPINNKGSEQDEVQ